MEVLGLQGFNLTKQFLNPNPGGNFSFGLGLGVAVIITRSSGGTLMQRAGTSAFVRIKGVELDFGGKERNDRVTV